MGELSTQLVGVRAHKGRTMVQLNPFIILIENA